MLLDPAVVFVGYSLSDPHRKALVPLVHGMLGTRTEWPGLVPAQWRPKPAAKPRRSARKKRP